MFSKARPSDYSPAPYHRLPDDKAAPSGSKVKPLPVQSAQSGSAKASSPKPESKSHSSPDRVLRAQALPVSPAVARMIHKDLAAIIVAAREQHGAGDAKTGGSRPPDTRPLLEQAEVDLTQWWKHAHKQENLAFMLQQLAASQAAIVGTSPRIAEFTVFFALLRAFLTDVYPVASKKFEVGHLNFLLQALPSAALLKTQDPKFEFAGDFTAALGAQLEGRSQLETALVKWIVSEVMRTDHEAPPDVLVRRHAGLFDAAMRVPATRLLLGGQLVQALQEGRNMPPVAWVALGNSVADTLSHDASALASTTGLIDDVFESVAAADQTLISAAYFLRSLICLLYLRTQTARPHDPKLAEKAYMHLQKLLERYLLKHPTLAPVIASDPSATGFDESMLQMITLGDAQKILLPGPAPSPHKASGSTASRSDRQSEAPFVADLSQQQTDAPFVAALTLPPKTGSTSSSSK